MSEITITREFQGNGIKSFTSRKTSILTKKHIASCLNFEKEHLEKGNEYWKTVIWSDEAKVEPFGFNAARHVWMSKGTVYDRKENTIPTTLSTRQIEPANGLIRGKSIFSSGRANPRTLI